MGENDLRPVRTDGMTNERKRVLYLSEYVLRFKKGTLKNPGEYFLKICQIFFEKNPVAQWKRVGLNLSTFLDPVGNSEQNGNV